MSKTSVDRWYVTEALSRPPQAVAAMRGSAAYPDLRGFVRFYDTAYGVLVCAELTGLPPNDGCGFFGFHIHETGDCREGSGEPFMGAGAHYAPTAQPHPCHAGDLPPLLSAGGYGLAVFLTRRFTVAQVMGRAVILHDRPDDFTTQPAGNAGQRIACGIIRRW
ncbi:MAG: superoxide dismutase family protein [Clostridia bacterium]|nr:superoxide dismutase family protein [Clostridia bacterium]